MKPIAPKLSIIIPCYNYGHFLSRALDSVIAQDSDDWEVIVVNDGSTDNTAQIANEYTEKIGRERFLYIEQENGGVSKARNTGISRSKGRYILLLDADDWISISYVSEATFYLDSHPECKAFRPSVQWHDSVGNGIGVEDNYSSYRNLLLYGQNSVFVYRKIEWYTLGGYDEFMRQGIEDWDFAIRFFYGEPIVYNSSSILYHYQRYSSEGSLSQSVGKKQDEVLWYIYLKHKNIYKEYFGNPILLARQREQYNWADRRLPQLAKKLQVMWQKINQKLS